MQCYCDFNSRSLKVYKIFDLQQSFMKDFVMCFWFMILKCIFLLKAWFSLNNVYYKLCGHTSTFYHLISRSHKKIQSDFPSIKLLLKNSPKSLSFLFLKGGMNHLYLKFFVINIFERPHQNNYFPKVSSSNNHSSSYHLWLKTWTFQRWRNLVGPDS